MVELLLTDRPSSHVVNKTFRMVPFVPALAVIILATQAKQVLLTTNVNPSGLESRTGHTPFA